MLPTSPPRRSRTSSSAASILEPIAALNLPEIPSSTPDGASDILEPASLPATPRSSQLSSTSIINASPTSPYAANANTSTASNRSASRTNSSHMTLDRRTISQLSNEIIAETPEPPTVYSTLLVSSLAAAEPTTTATQTSHTTLRAVPPNPNSSVTPPPNQSHNNGSDTANALTNSSSTCTCYRAPSRNTVLKLVLLIICIAATAATVFQWTINQDVQTWHETKCKIERAPEIEEEKGSGRYRIVANVSSIDDVKIKSPVTAYYGTDDTYNFQSEDTAENVLKDFEDSTSISCWVLRAEDPPRVSLKFVTPHITTYSVWLTTIVAVCTGLFLFFSIVSRISDRFYDLTNPNSNTIRNVRNLTQTPGNVASAANRPRCLSIRQTRFVCNVFGREWLPSEESPDDVSDWICSICLDEPDPNALKPIRTVLFPCTHRFHRSCIRYWLRKGKPACPLCQWDARQLFNEDGQPKQIVVDTAAAADTAPLQCVAVVRDDPTENVLTLHPEDRERFTQGVATWEYLNDEESISSAQTPQPPSGRLLG